LCAGTIGIRTILADLKKSDEIGRFPDELILKPWENTLLSSSQKYPRVLIAPQLVRRSRSDEAVRLFYEFYAQTIVGGKWLCVVVKYTENDAFVVTAYLTDKPKPGEDLWPIK
jgi:hypothetical protein